MIQRDQRNLQHVALRIPPPSDRWCHPTHRLIVAPRTVHHLDWSWVRPSPLHCHRDHCHHPHHQSQANALISISAHCGGPEPIYHLFVPPVSLGSLVAVPIHPPRRNWPGSNLLLSTRHPCSQDAAKHRIYSPSGRLSESCVSAVPARPPQRLHRALAARECRRPGYEAGCHVLSAGSPPPTRNRNHRLGWRACTRLGAESYGHPKHGRTRQDSQNPAD